MPGRSPVWSTRRPMHNRLFRGRMISGDVVSVNAVNVQPHGRILTVLGDIEFSQWQCLAELIDNAFDDFLSNPNLAQSAGRSTVSISLPGRSSDAKTAEVWVRDNGRGMDLGTLENAVRAGWTGNARYGSLGLFGMGFNIATARLGRVTTIKTTRAGDPSWTVLVLDLVTLARGESYMVPVRYEPKDHPDEHGTQIIISDLKPNQWEVLSRQEAKIRDQLGDVYSYLLRERDFLITVNNKKVQPRRPCLWDTSRTVTRNGVEIQAVLEIDRRLPSMRACLDCGWWNPLWSERCEDCRSEKLEERERRIWGWIGVQRYLHKSDFGIDFLRNGRKILVRDKRLFFWEDPDGIEGPELEYPIDSQRPKGRFVGEIHCDHVPVNYQKNAFEYDGPDWHTVIRTVRGDSPLREKIAQRLGRPINQSPLAKLFSGFRREDPGLNYLVPGDGKQALHDKAIDWAKKFRDGDAHYQTDEIWYEAAYRHDHPVVPEPPAEDDDVFGEMGLSDDYDTSAAPQGPGQPNSSQEANDTDDIVEETLDQRLSRYREMAVAIVDLTGRYEAPGLGQVELAAWGVPEHLENAVDEPVPIFTHMIRAPRVEIFVDVTHSLFTEYGVDMRDLAMIELAEFMRVRGTPSGREPRPLAVVLTDIKSRASDQKVTADALAARATRLLDRVRDGMQREIKGSPTGYWEMLLESERTQAQQRFAIEGGVEPWESAIESGDFVPFLPPSAVVRLLERRPDAFLDDKVFHRPYLGLTDESSRSLVVSRLVGFVGDLALMAEHRPRLSIEELARVRLSCLLVERDLVDSD